MGMRFQQAIPPQFLLQGSPNRFSQPISHLSFSQSQLQQLSGDGSGRPNAFQGQQSQLAAISSNPFSSSNTNQLLQESFDKESLQMHISPFSSAEGNFHEKLVTFL